MPHRQRDMRVRLSPRIQAYLGVRCQQCGFHGGGEGVGGDVVWEDEDGGLAIGHEISVYGEDVIGAVCVHVVEIGLDVCLIYVRAAFQELGRPAFDVVLVK